MTMWKLQIKSPQLTGFLYARYKTTFGQQVSLPWIQNFNDVFRKDPLHHRLVGLYLLRRILKQAKVPFNMKEFTDGVKEAVKVIADSVREQDSNKLSFMLGPSLYRHYHHAFEELHENETKIHLKLHAFKGTTIAGARFIFGDTTPGDEYVLKAFGQKIILSKSEIEEFEDDKGGNITSYEALSFGRRFGEAAFLKRIRFQFDVKFQTQESYELIPIDHVDSDESAKYSVVYHKWRFETPITYEKESFLDWTVVDIDDYLAKKYKTEIIEDE